MAPPIENEPPDTPLADPRAAKDAVYLFGAPKKTFGPATPSKLRQALLRDITSSPSQVADIDYISISPLGGKGRSNVINSTNGTKRPRAGDAGDEENPKHDTGHRAAATECFDQVTSILDKDRRLYEAKMKLFQDCAAAVDQTLNKAGTELYLHAKEFSTFFTKSLNEWLTNGNRLPLNSSRATAPPTNMTFAQAASTSIDKTKLQAKASQTSVKQQVNQHQKTPREDLRVFVRMDNNRLEPYGVKETLIRRLRLDYQEIREVTPCASGFALHPRDKATQNKLLALQDEITNTLKARKVEAHTVWHHYKIGGCPRKVMSAEGLTIDITESTVANEAEAQTGQRPVRCILSRNTTDADPETTWMVSFSSAIRKTFTLFAHSLPSKHSRRDPKIHQCEGCFKFHGKNYRCEKKICVNCARPVHEGACEKPVAKCANCNGPHAANFEKCPARPKVTKGIICKLSAEQLCETRLAGDRARSHAFNKLGRQPSTDTNQNTDARGANGENTAMETDTAGTKLPSEVDTIVVCQ